MLSAISLNHSFNSPRITIILGTVGWGEKYNACTQKSSTSSRCPSLIKPCGAASPWHFVMDSCKPRPCGQADAALTGRRSATLGAIQQRHRVRASSCYPMLASGVDAWNEGCDTENASFCFPALCADGNGWEQNSCFRTIWYFCAGNSTSLCSWVDWDSFTEGTLLLLIARKFQLLKRIPAFVCHILFLFLSFGLGLLIGQNKHSKMSHSAIESCDVKILISIY